MKNRKIFLVMLLLPFMWFMASCGGGNEKTKVPEAEEQSTVEKTNEFKLLANYLKENGDYINAPVEQGGAPQFISADELNELLGGYILIIDIRGSKSFAQGHIPGAVNVNLATLINYMEDEVNVDDYDKIVLVCHSGQTSGLASAVLRMMGYNTVYSLKWGMSSWNKKFAESKWLARETDNYVNQLETAPNPKAAPGDFPEISTGYTEPKEILKEQALRLLAKGFGKVAIKSDDVWANPSAYYIVNIMPGEAYNAGHIPGAVQYNFKASFGLDQALNTLPKDKPVLVYCFSGQGAARVVAYLRILGYDAYTLLYGANSFMHSIIVEHNWPAFTEKNVHNFEFEESEFDASGGEEEGAGGC
jgi:rhodanese-related sulfurtransferase